MATIDQDGFIYIVDRKDDFIKSYGYRVSSQDVESCVLELSEVVAVAAIGAPDLVKGEAIIAFVMVKPAAVLMPQNIIDHVAKRLPNYMVPTKVIFVDTFRLNANGKVRKSELRSLLERSSGSDKP